MIPIKLALRNFMCYRDNVPPINFEGIHTACISGNNGNGKSALIDAITWALWGQTRATNDDELVHAGQSEAEVEYEFAVGMQNYRIIRKHSKPKTQKSSGQTLLEFQLITPEGNKVLTGDTTTLTQQKIIQVLHMDYDTFINSAFLRQGRADEFTKKRPGERKQVLGNILQLSVYDELEEQSKQMLKEQESAITQIEMALKSFQEELAFKPVHQSEFDQAQAALGEAEKAVQEQELRLRALRQEKASLETKKSQLTELSGHFADTDRNFNLWNAQAQQCRQRIQQYEALIEQRDAIEGQYQQYLETQKLFQEKEHQFKQSTALEQGKHRLEMAIVKAGEDLNRRHAVIESHLNDMEMISGKLPQLQEEIRQVVEQLKILDDLEIKLQEKRENSKLQRARVHFLQAEKVRLTQEIEQTEEKIKMLAHEEGATCPLCETELGIEGQKRIEAKYQAEKIAKVEALKITQAESTQKDAEVRAMELEIAQIEVKLKNGRETGQNKYGNLNKAISDAREAMDKIVTEKEALSEIEQKLASRDFALNEQEALIRIEKEMQAIDYDPRQHEALRARLNELTSAEPSKRKLEEAERLIVQEREAESKACQTAADLHSRLESDLQRKQTLTIELARFNNLEKELAASETQYQSLAFQQKRWQETTGAARAKLERLTEVELKSKEKESDLNKATRQEKIYRDLAQAFGKKGIQAMLIEMTIPEIEMEANKLLARMTDNRMSIKMETQRETKKGEVMETLDINIADELGTRSYEMFSGGEAFRIDFAIRIALSKLLARRAGAPLPTLIIDEGFGTQDANGIEKIKEAITSIQDDFEKILVITHIADFKDAFPLRIEVVKTPEGSNVYLN